MGNPEKQPRFRAGVGLLMALLFSVSPAVAQKSITVTDFSVVPGYYDPPHEKQMRSLLHGARAQPLPARQYLITDAELRTFLEDGQPQLTVAAPQCLYDSEQHAISSPGPLRVQTADGKFSIAGVGFLWQQTNSSLVISNRVHTFAHPDLLEPRQTASAANPPAPVVGGIEISADRFAYAAATGLGIYSGNVSVTGSNFSLAEGSLTVRVPVSQGAGTLQSSAPGAGLRNVKLQSLTAEHNVVADYETADHEKVHATGERAIYSTDTGLLRVSGHPAWRSGQREGSGDELLIDRTNKLLQASGHAWLKLPVPGKRGAGFLPGIDSPATNSPPATNVIMEIWSDNYEVRTNQAVFRRTVRLARRCDDQPRGGMTCGLLTVAFSGTNHLQRMVAEDAVVVEQDDKQFTGGRAVYDDTNGVLVMTGNPTWRIGPREGRGDRMQVNMEHEDVAVRGNASMRFPAEELASAGAARSGASITPRLPGATNQLAEIFSEEYSVRREPGALTAQFRGGVYVTHPQMNLACENMTVRLPPAGRQVESILARKGVTFDLLNDKGQELHGSGEQAVYTCAIGPAATNRLVELTGNPTLQTTNGLFRNPIILVDLANGRVTAPPGGGKYVIRSSVPVDTNKFRWPAQKSTH